MSSLDTTELDEEERAAFLGTGGTGVLSFAVEADEPPYSLPVSYGYDDQDGVFYFRLGFENGGEKTSFVDEKRPVSFVTYADTAGGWHSVVVTGRLAEVTEAAVGSEAMQGLGRVEIPLVDIFERPDQEVTFRFFRLKPDAVTGRREVPR